MPINNIINQNNKNLEIIKKEISVKFEQIEKKFNELKLNTMNNQEKIIDDGKYVGQTLNGIAEGKGIWIGLNNNFKSEKYEGYWSKDKKNGKGIYYFNNGDIYNGDWKEGKIDGNGIYYYNNGNRYEGNWINGKREGKGILYFSNGDIYEGDWKNDKRDGKAIYYYNDGDRSMGNYSKGKPSGKHARLTKEMQIKIDNY